MSKFKLFISSLIIFSIAAVPMAVKKAKAQEEKAPATGHAKKGKEEKIDLENRLYLELKDGRVVIELMPDVAPKHVERIKELARAKFYDGIVFHRVIDGFMAQTGDPTGTGMGGSDKSNLKAEFSTIPHDKGILSMARAGDPDSANSQFFIVLEDSHFLDNKYTVWGRVVSGMEFVEKIKKGDARKNGSVEKPDKIVSFKVAADVKEE